MNCLLCKKAIPESCIGYCADFHTKEKKGIICPDCMIEIEAQQFHINNKLIKERIKNELPALQ